MKELNEKLVNRINSIKVPKEFLTLAENLDYIPLGSRIVLKKEDDSEWSGLLTTAGGILKVAQKSTFEHRGRIVAMGPECSSYLKLGLLVNYNGMADIGTLINGEEYVLNHELSIEGIIGKSENVVFTQEIPSGETTDRANRQSEFKKGVKAIRRDGENKIDAIAEKRKDARKNPITSKYKK